MPGLTERQLIALGAKPAGGLTEDQLLALGAKPEGADSNVITPGSMLDTLKSVGMGIAKGGASTIHSLFAPFLPPPGSQLPVSGASPTPDVFYNRPASAFEAQNTPELVGKGIETAAEMIAPMINSQNINLARAMYQRALKPSTVMGETARQKIINTALKEGIPVSKGGAEKLWNKVNALNEQIFGGIGEAAQKGLTVNPQEVSKTAEPLIDRFAMQVNPESDVNSVKSAIKEFLSQHVQPTGETVSKLIPYGESGTQFADVPVVGPRPIPVDAAQAIKQGTYRALGDKAYGELKGASIEAQKALARGLKEGIVGALKNDFPELNALNAREGALLDLSDALEKAVGRIGNRDVIGIGTPLLASGAHAIGASNPAVAAAGLSKFLVTPQVMSRLAIAIAKGASVNTGIPAKALLPIMAAKVAAWAQSGVENSPNVANDAGQ